MEVHLVEEYRYASGAIQYGVCLDKEHYHKTRVAWIMINNPSGFPLVNIFSKKNIKEILEGIEEKLKKLDPTRHYYLLRFKEIR